MMLDIKKTVLYIHIQYYYFISGLLLLGFVLEMFYFLSLDVLNDSIFMPISSLNWFNLVLETSGIKVLGCLYTNYFFPFLLAGLVLFVAMIGAILLTLSPTSSEGRQQLVYEQLASKPENSIFYVK